MKNNDQSKNRNSSDQNSFCAEWIGELYRSCPKIYYKDKKKLVLSVLNHRNGSLCAPHQEILFLGSWIIEIAVVRITIMNMCPTAYNIFRCHKFLSLLTDCESHISPKNSDQPMRGLFNLPDDQTHIFAPVV